MKKLIQGNLYLHFFSEEDGAPFVRIYGDPKGLRYLAGLLEEVAAVDQEALPLHQLPVDEGYHLHMSPGIHLNKESAAVLLGRMDARKTGTFDWFVPPIAPNGKGLVKPEGKEPSPQGPPPAK